MSDETTAPNAGAQEEEFEAHGLKEVAAAAAVVGALAVPTAAQAYVPIDDDGQMAKPAQVVSAEKTATKGKAAKKKAAPSVSKAPLKKPPLQIDG